MSLQHRGMLAWPLRRVLLVCCALASATCQLDERDFDAVLAAEGAAADGGPHAPDGGDVVPSSGVGGSSSSSAGSAGEASRGPVDDGELGGSGSSGGESDAGSLCEDDGGACSPASECLRDTDCPISAPHCNDSNHCIACVSDAECNDGYFCSGAEICNSQGQCVPGPEPCSGPDGDADCSESCSEEADDCTGNDVRSSACAGGGSCDGAGACLECLGGSDCSPAQPYCSGSGACVVCLEDAHCSDGVFCNGAETCTEGLCSRGAVPCPGPDGDADCSEVCDEDADSCTGNDPEESACSGGLCTGSGVCAQCLEDEHCPLAAPFCLGTVCVECLLDGNCPSPTCTRGVCGQANRCETVVVCGP